MLRIGILVALLLNVNFIHPFICYHLSICAISWTIAVVLDIGRPRVHTEQGVESHAPLNTGLQLSVTPSWAGNALCSRCHQSSSVGHFSRGKHHGCYTRTVLIATRWMTSVGKSEPQFWSGAGQLLQGNAQLIPFSQDCDFTQHMCGV